LLAEKKFSEARVELARIPEAKRKTAQWLSAELILVEAENGLPHLVEQWKKNPADAPVSSDLQNAIPRLGETSRRIVQRFVYERALEARELTAPNFLGLAAIDLDDGDVSGAVALLKRLTLISATPYADADSAASLLETKKRFAEALPFLQPLAEAFPWESSYRIRVAVAMLAVNPQSTQALQSLASVATNPQAKYSERVSAAKALKGHSTTALTSGSVELDLLARAVCPGFDDANRPFFVEARRAAAICPSNNKAQERLLGAALAEAPSNSELRLQYIAAAFGAGQDARALLASEPILENGGSFYGQRFSQGYDAFHNEGSYGQHTIPTLSTLKPDEAAKLTWFAIHAREKRQETVEALQLLHSARSLERDTRKQNTLDKEIKRLETDAAREVENEARAPKIHVELDQDRMVRPRLLPGTAFTPRKAARNEGDME